MARGAASVFPLVCMWALAGSARGERIALHGADAKLERATVAALAAWHVGVIRVSGEGPGTRMPEAARRADAMARAQAARAVVWMAVVSAEPTLWVYDVATGRAVALRLASGPPFDEPTAAAVALTIKTLLRYGEVAPPGERYRVPPPVPTRIALEARAGACSRPEPAATWEPRFALTALVRLPGADRVLIGVGARAGPGLAVTHGDFSGRYQDLAMTLAGRVELDLRDRLVLVPVLGMSLHLVGLSGTSQARMEAASADFLDPAIDAGVQLEVRIVSQVRLALLVEGSYLIRRQRFLAGDEEVFDIPGVSGELGAALVVGLF